jgi:hypothetical protein
MQGQALEAYTWLAGQETLIFMEPKVHDPSHKISQQNCILSQMTAVPNVTTVYFNITFPSKLALLKRSFRRYSG